MYGLYGDRTLPNLHELLKAETAPLHSRLETLPFFSQLHEGTLPKTAIVSFLRCLSIIHAIVERSLADATDKNLRTLELQVSPKLPLLTADLTGFDPQLHPSIIPAIDSALDFGAEILRNADKPLGLLGILYVLEGSQNGGATLKNAYARCLKTDPETISYIGCYGTKTAETWRSFVQGLNSLTLNADETLLVVLSARKTFEWFDKLCTALYPYSEQNLRHHVAAINFEAGDHAIPQNPNEIALALRAGKKAWDKYPYLEQRFGERGRRFTSSDSCWLVALTQMPIETVNKNLKWLRSVLAARGLPSVILEGHLKEISQMMASESKFNEFLSCLENERKHFDKEARLSGIVQHFEERFLTCSGFKTPSAAQLIASAWIDEQAKISNALKSTQQWFSDSARFSKDWIANVDELIVKLNQLGPAPC
jgi:heme oxygenase